ncbi:MAG: PIN domain-containing protein [Candidatus Micrarchaeota archaeon]
MKLIVDTNIIIAAIIKDSTTRRLLLRFDLELFSPEYLFEELNEHREEIIRKAKINEQDFEDFCQVIRRIIHIVPKTTYAHHLAEAAGVIEDENDWPFAAVALSAGDCGIWSNDPHFTQKSKELFEKHCITIWTTHRLYEFINDKL